MRVLKTIIIMLALAMLCACGKIPEAAGPGNVSGTKNDEPAETIETGELIEFRHYPGYSDMDGGYHGEIMMKDESGEWIIECCDKKSIDDPEITTVYSVNAKDEQDFEAFLKDKKVASLANRGESDEFATDYSPWGYTMIFADPSPEVKKRIIVSFGQYKEYSDEDSELIKELSERFNALKGEVLSETVESDEEPEDIKTYCKFYDIVADNDPAQWDRFALIDLDGDGIFELFATCIDGEREDPGIQPYMIVGHNDEDVIKNDELFDGVAGAGGYRGALYYLEGKGKLHESMIFAPMGEPADRVYQLKDGKINDTDVGEFTADRTIDMYADDRDMFEHGEWRWNGKTVTEDEYKNALREATDNTHGKPLCEIDWMSTDEVQSKLQNLIDGIE